MARRPVESRTNASEQKALERVIRRAVAHKNWTLVEGLFQELGVLLSEQTNEAQPTG